MNHDPSSASDSRERQPHAVLDYDSRVDKAKKIIAIIGVEKFRAARRVLEIGCGSGAISSSLSAFSDGEAEFHAIDVVDNRIVQSGYSFQLVDGTGLPFEDGFFDVVITNHVIEHVGDEQDQLAHLREIGRVLGKSGIVYLAVPNKWRLIEPHFRLPFLSWLPQPFADSYVRLLDRGKYYDCVPLSYHEALRYFARTGFAATDQTIRGLRQTLVIEHPRSGLARLVNAIVPDWVIRAGMAVMPTYIFLLRRRV